MEYFTSLSDKEFQSTLLLCLELRFLYHVIFFCPVKKTNKYVFLATFGVYFPFVFNIILLHSKVFYEGVQSGYKVFYCRFLNNITATNDSKKCFAHYVLC